MKKRFLVIFMLTIMLIASVPTQLFAASGNAPGDVKYFRALSAASSIVLRWQKVPGATSYVLKYAGGGKKVQTKEITLNMTRKVPGNSSLVEYVFPAKLDKNLNVPKFNFTLRAKNKNGQSPKSYPLLGIEPVKKMYINVTFKTDRTLTSHTGGRVKAHFDEGTTIKTVGYDNNGKYIFPYKGRLYYVLRISVGNAKPVQLKPSHRYIAAEAENFVNQMGLKSSNSYLIWVNTYTQREYIFRGSKGKWKCVKSSWVVSTGKPSTPTATGLTRIKQKDRISNGTLYWNVCSVFSLHGLYRGQPLGYPRSSACVRNTDEHAKWIYNNCPIGTAVYIF